MRIDSLTINIADISETLSLGENSVVAEIFSASEKVVSQGGKIILQINYGGSKPEFLAKFTTVDEVENWKDKLNEIQIIRKRTTID